MLCVNVCSDTVCLVFLWLCVCRLDRPDTFLWSWWLCRCAKLGEILSFFFFLPLVEQQYLVKMWKCHKKVATMSFTEVPGLKRLSPSQDSDHSPFPTAEKNLPSWSHIQFFLSQNLKRCGINDNSQIPRACADDWQQACQLPLMFLHGQIFSQQFLHAWS